MTSKTYQDYVEEIDLQRYWLVLKRRWLPATLVLGTCVAGSVFVALTREPAYSAEGTILVRPDLTPTLTGVGRDLRELPISINNLQNQSSVLLSTAVMQSVIDNLDLTDDEGLPLKPTALSSKIEVESAEQADILQVSYNADDPEEAAAVVNAVMDAYLARDVLSNRLKAATAREFIERQLPIAEADLDRAAAALQQFKDANGIVVLEDEATVAVTEIARLDTQIRDVSSTLASANTQASELQEQLSIPLAQAKQIETLSQSTAVQQALEDLQLAQAELASQRSLYRDTHPTIINLERRVASLQSLLSDRVEEIVGTTSLSGLGNLQMSPLDQQLTTDLATAEVNRSSLASQLQSLVESRNRYAERIQAFPALEKRQLELTQRLQAAQLNYENLLAAFQQTQLAENQTVGSAEILERAEPAEGAGSLLIPALVAGTFVGSLLGVACAFFLDLVDKSVKTAKDGEMLLGYTLLGLVPKFRSRGSDGSTTYLASRLGTSGLSAYIPALDRDQPMVSAAFQMLQANLKFTSSDTSHRIITITSSVSEEGKSEVSANLAATLAHSGKQVLLIDADLRSPSQHHIWDVVNRAGLSQVLIREETQQDVTHQVFENLTLMTAGALPPNPLAILDSERMADLLQQLKRQYDYILIDTPPLLGAADAAVMGRMSDGVLLVLRPRKVDSANALAAKSFLERSQANVLGVVANGVDINNEHGDYVSRIRAGEYGKVPLSEMQTTVR
ncbi:polysaccharide biosynthesis tyrosine autokinase [Nodosilinea sp. LEGE 06152]|uniref:GumC family protein n=1 Tax=Nodosilinea sp. LEGE 06152 TaxID=2777966 RepID=UPI001881A8A6|nr:polysaccharide biosynthesis tyrosine autokinase [Nodosilinea sp. LEGE 06152]MBE9157557.1 polysaccharide biosynthesis tyrosine autokinase [Nodosilinea sp. LEGE 06152]